MSTPFAPTNVGLKSWQRADGTSVLSLEIDHNDRHAINGGTQTDLEVEGSVDGLNLAMGYTYTGRYNDECSSFVEITLTQEEEAELLLLLTLRAEGLTAKPLTDTP